MQEEVENRVYNLAVSTTKLTANTVIRAAMRYLEKRKQAKRSGYTDPGPHGKQTVKQLIGQHQGVSTVDIAKTDLHGFERFARKYGIDYAIRKDNSLDPPKYLIFFKSRDSDTMSVAFKDYTASLLRKQQKVSLLHRLQKYKQQAKARPTRAVPHKEQSL